MKLGIVLVAGLLSIPTTVHAQAIDDPANAPQSVTAILQAATLQNGIFEYSDRPDSAPIVLTHEGTIIWVRGQRGVVEYRRQADGSFHWLDSEKDELWGLRVLDPTTAEFFAPNDPDAPRLRLVRRNGAAPQAEELRYGYFRLQDPRRSDQAVFDLQGDVVRVAAQGRTAEYHRQPDGSFLMFFPSGNVAARLRIVDMYTVEIFTLSQPAAGPFRYTREGDATPNWIADVRRNELLAERRQQEAVDRWIARDAAEDAAWLEEQAAIEAETAQRSVPASGGANVLQGFMKGLSEATEQNQAMEQSMDNAINRGLAEGAAEYARRQDQIAREEAAQRAADAEYARQVRAQEEADRQARLAEQQRAQEFARQARTQEEADRQARLAAAERLGAAAGGQGTSSSSGRPGGAALRGFFGRSCEEALASAVYTTPGSTFEEIEREETAGGCTVRGYLTTPAGPNVSRQ